MLSFWQNVRFRLRMLRNNPGFRFVAILTLAFGIGASTAIFSVVDTVLRRSLPFPHPVELVAISARITTYDIPYLPLSYPDFAELRSTSSSFSSGRLRSMAFAKLEPPLPLRQTDHRNVRRRYFRKLRTSCAM